MRIPATSEGLGRHTDAIKDLATGGTNSAGSFTLDAGATTTTVTDENCTTNSVIHVSPRSSAAAASGWWIASTQKGSFTVGHPSAAAGCLFDYEVRRYEARR